MTDIGVKVFPCHYTNIINAKVILFVTLTRINR